MRFSEICVKRIRVNQGLSVIKIRFQKKKSPWLGLQPTLEQGIISRIEACHIELILVGLAFLVSNFFVNIFLRKESEHGFWL